MIHKILRKTKQLYKQDIWIALGSEDLHTWMIENIQDFYKSSQMNVQWSEPKMFGEKERKLG